MNDQREESALRTWYRRAWRHAWKLCLLPLFFDVPKPVKYACAAIIAASLVADVWSAVRKRRQAHPTTTGISEGS